MLSNYLFLIFGWILFYATHSFLAHNRVKDRLKIIQPNYFKYYRLLYNFFSIIFFLLLLYYQFNLQQVLFLGNNFIREISGIAFLLSGFIVLSIAFLSFNKLEFIGIEQLHNNQKKELESVKKLVKCGFYAYVRHPLYFGIILMLIGIILYFPSFPMLVFVIVSLIYLPVGVVLEEQKLIKEFGNEYKVYQQEVKMLLPFIV